MPSGTAGQRLRGLGVGPVGLVVQIPDRDGAAQRARLRTSLATPEPVESSNPQTELVKAASPQAQASILRLWVLISFLSCFCALKVRASEPKWFGACGLRRTSEQTIVQCLAVGPRPVKRGTSAARCSRASAPTRRHCYLLFTAPPPPNGFCHSLRVVRRRGKAGASNGSSESPHASPLRGSSRANLGAACRGAARAHQRSRRARPAPVLGSVGNL